MAARGETGGAIALLIEHFAYQLTPDMRKSFWDALCDLIPREPDK